VTSGYRTDEAGGWRGSTRADRDTAASKLSPARAVDFDAIASRAEAGGKLDREQRRILIIFSGTECKAWDDVTESDAELARRYRSRVAGLAAHGDAAPGDAAKLANIYRDSRRAALAKPAPWANKFDGLREDE